MFDQRKSSWAAFIPFISLWGKTRRSLSPRIPSPRLSEAACIFKEVIWAGSNAFPASETTETSETICKVSRNNKGEFLAKARKKGQ